MLLPTTISEESRDSRVPSTVKGGAPGVRVEPATTTLLGPMVSFWPPMVIMLGVWIGVGRAWVEVPITSPEGPSEMGVPDMVIAGPFAVRILSSIMRPLLLLVKVSPLIMRVLGVGEETCVGSGMVEVPITMLEPAREIGVPETVIPGAPGIRVWPDTTTPDGIGVIVCPVDDVRVEVWYMRKRWADSA